MVVIGEIRRDSLAVNRGMIAYIILIIAVIAAIASLYVIYQVEKNPEVGKAVGKKDSGPFDTSGNLVFDQEITPPYATDDIQSVDDYEYNMVFENEGDRGVTKSTRDLLMSQYPMDWSTQPPSSSHFQEGLAKFKEGFQGASVTTPSSNPYNSIDGDMKPPVYKDEKDILATYVPKKPNELTTYDAADAKEIVDRIYGAKGLVADFKKTGDNTYTILGTRKKDAPVVYEADGTEEASGSHAVTSSQPVASAGEALIVPATVENYKTPDPFFTVNPNNRTRDGKWDYSSWTPGLERMFAPTEPQVNWY
jgi:hypothetical protein